MGQVSGFGMCSVGFEGCMHILRRGGKTLILVTYVDDCLLLYDDDSLLESFKEHIGRKFKYTEEGSELSWHIGVKYDRDWEAGTVKLTQTAYIDELLRKFGMEKCNPVSTPMVAHTHLSRADCLETPILGLGEKYREMVGLYQWLLTMTRPDLGFVVSELSRFLANPGKEHMDAAVQVLQYLKETRLLGLKYSRDG
eukprot:1081039-Rhodomonas_salina.1